MNSRVLLSLGCTAIILAGCSTAPIAEDKLPVLKGDQGIAAISFESDLTITQVVIVPVSGSGGKLYIAQAAYGQSVYMFVTPVGQYCMRQFHYGSEFFTAKHDDQCFDVTPGKISYSGTFSPYNGSHDDSVGDSPGGMVQRQDPRAFLDALSVGYPNIAMHTFPSITAGSKSLGICDLVAQDEAASILGMPVRDKVEKSLADIDTCALVNSDEHAVFLTSLTGSGLEARFVSIINAAPINGWLNWKPISFVGTQARGGNKENEYEMVILLQDRLLVLSVYGGTRNDTMDEMTGLARTIISKLPSH